MRGPLVIGEPATFVQAQLAAEDPYRADTVIDGGCAFGLTIRAASVRGLGKRWSGGPRQDDICLRRHEPTQTLIAALADGVSAAPRSHIGASLAVRHAAAAVSRQLDRDCELDWQEVFQHAGWALLDAHRCSSDDPTAGVAEASAALATTLLLAIVSAPDDGVARVELACLGDSPALMLGSRGFIHLLGAREDPLELVGGSVDALPRAAAAVCSACCELRDDQTLLLCSDGLSLPLGDGTGEVGAVFARELARPPGIADFAKLLDFSRSTYDDDRSLIAIWPRELR